MIPSIIYSLEQHGLLWDGELEYQSKRHSLYESVLNKLNKQERLYGCHCSRKERKSRSVFYDGHCRNLNLELSGHAIRYKQRGNCAAFFDLLWAEQLISNPIIDEDPILKRADNIYTYHLAVVADDIAQGVTHIVRGLDLLDTTPIHLSLYNALGEKPPEYAHIPLVCMQANNMNVYQKLSKQNLAPAINDKSPLINLALALEFLGVPIDLQPKFTRVSECLDWAIANWNINLMPKTPEILISVTNGVYSPINKNIKESTKK